MLKPRNIVSGDFYWLTIRKNFLLIAVADCTGHGVPGAFMSMLGISFLNEIVVQEEVTKANQVLNILREYVLKSLQQRGVLNENPSTSQKVQDGMDIAFICINLESTFSDSGVEQFDVQFAGANNSLYVVRKSKDENLSTFNFQLDELKGDKMPVSIYKNMPDFTNHELKLQKTDTIYLCSDGYSDQFGGPNERKFLSKNLKKLLEEISDKPMEEQKTILNKTIESWMNDFGKTFEQTDDITVMGIKL